MTNVQGGHNQRISETYTDVKADQFTCGASARRVATARQKNWTTLIQASPDNQGVVYVGDQLLQPVQLAAGESITIATDAYAIFVRGSGQTVNILMLV